LKNPNQEKEKNILNFSKHSLTILEERGIKQDWIFETINNPEDFQKVSDNEIHFIKNIIENENRCLKVVFNLLTNTLITAFFDRGLKKKGCKFEISI